MGLSADSGAQANGTPSSWAAKKNIGEHFIGGNHLGQASPSKVKDFVANHDGHTVITNVRPPPALNLASGRASG